MQTAFRYVLLMGILIIPLYFSSIDEKFPIMVGAVIGGTIAFWVGYFLLKRKKRKMDAEQKK